MGSFLVNPVLQSNLGFFLSDLVELDLLKDSEFGLVLDLLLGKFVMKQLLLILYFGVFKRILEVRSLILHLSFDHGDSLLLQGVLLLVELSGKGFLLLPGKPPVLKVRIHDIEVFSCDVFLESKLKLQALHVLLS